MNEAKLSWDHDQEGVRFWLQAAGGSRIALDQWGTHSIVTAWGAGSVGHLLAMVEDDLVEVDNDVIVLSHAQVAALEPVQLQRLGLPAPAPWRLELRGSGLLSTPSFRFLHRLIGADGRPILGVRRTGALVQSGQAAWTLVDPI